MPHFEADDLMQDMLLAAVRSPGKVARVLDTEAHLAHWFRQVAAERAKHEMQPMRDARAHLTPTYTMSQVLILLDFLADEDALTGTAFLADQPATADWSHALAMLSDVKSAIANLKAADRDAIGARHLLGEEFAATAAHLGLADESAARKRYTRALDRLVYALNSNSPSHWGAETSRASRRRDITTHALVNNNTLEGAA